jgi:hypothetical protein
VTDAPEAGQSPPDAPSAPDAAPATGRVRGVKRRFAKRWTRRTFLLGAAALAAAFLSVFTVDIGRLYPGLRELAERQGSKYLERHLTIGALRASLTPGVFVVENLRIAGPAAGSRPFLEARRITVRLSWYSLLTLARDRRALFAEVEMDGWRMVMETKDGRTPLPRFTRQGTRQGPSPFTTTVRFVHARNGEFIYDDLGAPWSVVCRNLSFSLVRAENLEAYVGTMRFARGTVQIQAFEPFGADLTTRFVLDWPRVRLQHIDLVTDGAVSHLSGVVDFSKGPEHEYHIQSTVDFPRMREIFFAREAWRLAGTGGFTGVFKVGRTSRNLSGEFRSEALGINDLTLRGLHGALTWLPGRFAVTHAEADVLGGHARMVYALEPLGHRAVRPRATFSADYTGIGTLPFMQWNGWRALMPDGRMDGHVSLAWPNGRFVEVQGRGQTAVSPAGGAAVAGARLQPRTGPTPAASQPFDPRAPIGRFPVAGLLSYRFTRTDLDFDESWAATPSTFARFAGHARGGPARLPFHVTSHDWQASARLLSAILTQFGTPAGAIEVGGQGTFDGVLTESFSAPRIAGSFAGEGMRVWAVEWGRATGDMVLHGRFVDVRDGRIENGRGGLITTSGRYAVGYQPQAGEEIRAAVTVAAWPLQDFRTAFELTDWPVDATVADGRMTLEGAYRQPRGDGRLRLDRGTAWGESFETAGADLVFEGDGSLRLRRLELAKAPGRIAGDVWLSWADGTYSFSADGEQIDVGTLANFALPAAPLTGRLQFRARGAGAFVDPSYTFEGRIADLYAGAEGIGEVRGTLTVKDDLVTIDSLDAASDRLQVTGSGSIALTDRYDARLFLRFFETSLDPYLRLFESGRRLSPFTRAVASGAISVDGALADPAALSVSVRLEDVALTLFDYLLRNDGDIVLAFERDVFRTTALRLRGTDTNLDVSGSIDRGRRLADVRASGQANLAILQLFYPDLSADGSAVLAASLSGSLDQLALTGSADLKNGRLKYQTLPHSLTDLNGPLRIGGGRLTLDGLRGAIGGGDVTFSGYVTLDDGYRPEEYHLRADGRRMNLRYPEGLASEVSATLELTGTVRAPLLRGDVDVIRARYNPRLPSGADLFGLAGAPIDDAPAVTPAESAPATPMALDITIRAPVMPFIERGTAATIEGSAAARVTGTIAQPVLTGRVDIVRGQVTFVGNRYMVRRGSVDFANPLRFEPYFDIEADTRARAGGQTFDIKVRLTGTLASLVPTLVSEPALPQSQLVSLIFGESPQIGESEILERTSPQDQQAKALRAMGAALIANTITSPLGDVMQRTLPVDTVAFTTPLGNESSLQQLRPDLRVTLGTRLSSRVFLTYTRSINTSESEIILIEFNQSDRVSWILSRNEDRSFALDLRLRYVVR